MRFIIRVDQLHTCQAVPARYHGHQAGGAVTWLADAGRKHVVDMA